MFACRRKLGGYVSTADGYVRKLEENWGKVHTLKRCTQLIRTECAAWKVLDRNFAFSNNLPLYSHNHTGVHSEESTSVIDAHCQDEQNALLERCWIAIPHSQITFRRTQISILFAIGGVLGYSTSLAALPAESTRLCMQLVSFSVALGAHCTPGTSCMARMGYMQQHGWLMQSAAQRAHIPIDPLVHSNLRV